MQTGKAKDESGSVEFSPERIVGHIDEVIAVLERSANPELREDIERAIERLRRLSADHSNDLETADQALSDIENFLEHALLKLDTSAIEKDVAAQLRPYRSQMEADAYKQTSRVMMLKRLREEEGIPRLSLFYL
jgi:hypothetical protein